MLVPVLVNNSCNQESFVIKLSSGRVRAAVSQFPITSEVLLSTQSRVRMLILVSPELKSELRAAARQDGRSVTRQAERALEHYVSSRKKFADVVFARTEETAATAASQACS
jgi:predicted transcriptional regulator